MIIHRCRYSLHAFMARFHTAIAIAMPLQWVSYYFNVNDLELFPLSNSDSYKDVAIGKFWIRRDSDALHVLYRHHYRYR